ncbi:hypothetical protein KM043_013391 [Ampulex compressa]|nr:hypothetical protein KM043_013391 [Ampulex compressa]
MKYAVLALVLFCAFAYGSTQIIPDTLYPTPLEQRYRRQTNPRGSVSVEATKPLGGPDRRPSVDVNYNHRVFDNGRGTADAYGGLNIRPGQPPQPHIGLQWERQYRNGFIRGHGQVQRGPGGNPSPSFGVSGGFRFRRDAEEQRYRRQANPQGSVRVEATKPLDGPDRRPSVDVNYNQRVFDNGRATADAYGGLNIRPGQPPQPHIGLQWERQYRNGFIRGHGQVQRGPGGNPSPSFGVSGGFRFRREAEVDELEQ